MGIFKIKSEYKLAGDQPKAVDILSNGIKSGIRDQTLMGVTGSGKTFTMANIISNLNKPAIIMVHNKTLAAQIYEEMKIYFPENAVEYFVSYYDYYQPEAYIPRTDTYIEKDSSINEHIDLMRHSATRSLLERKDTIVVSSVSCIYGIGSPVNYSEMTIGIKKGDKITQKNILDRLVALQYERNEIEFTRGRFRVKGDVIDIFPSYSSKIALKVIFFGNEIEMIYEFDPISGQKNRTLNAVTIYANSHYVTPRNVVNGAIKEIKKDLKARLDYLYQENKLLEAQRLQQKTEFDLEMLELSGSCKSIENYSRYLTGRKEGDPPPTLFEYIPKDAILFIDESHVSIPQVRAMYNGDRARKMNLVDYGFRLPSALDNRPLKFDEWDQMRPLTIYVSATPSPYEVEKSNGITAEQINRPTGLIDPVCIVKPAQNQVDDLLDEIKNAVEKEERVLVTTLTKKSAENLSEYLMSVGIKVSYLHSEVVTLERMKIIGDLRRKKIDVLVGINLLREGLDIPECALVAILDADKEGFLRSETSLVQTIGRAARNLNGRVILYADKMTKSLEKAISETNRRREKQIAFNKENNISPKSIVKFIRDEFYDIEKEGGEVFYENENLSKKQLTQKIKKFTKQMLKEANDMNFEKAASLRDYVASLEKLLEKM